MVILKMRNNFGNEVSVEKTNHCIRVNVRSQRGRFGSDESMRSQANMVARRALYRNPVVHSESYGNIESGNGRIVGRWAKITYTR